MHPVLVHRLHLLVAADLLDAAMLSDPVRERRRGMEW